MFKLYKCFFVCEEFNFYTVIPYKIMCFILYASYIRVLYYTVGIMRFNPDINYNIFGLKHQPKNVINKVPKILLLLWRPKKKKITT